MDQARRGSRGGSRRVASRWGGLGTSWPGEAVTAVAWRRTVRLRRFEVGFVAVWQSRPVEATVRLGPSAREMAWPGRRQFRGRASVCIAWIVRHGGRRGAAVEVRACQARRGSRRGRSGPGREWLGVAVVEWRGWLGWPAGARRGEEGQRINTSGRLAVDSRTRSRRRKLIGEALEDLAATRRCGRLLARVVVDAARPSDLGAASDLRVGRRITRGRTVSRGASAPRPEFDPHHGRGTREANAAPRIMHARQPDRIGWRRESARV